MPSNNRIDVRIENIGPIRRASINLNRLTVIIGPNNAGKSVLAMVLYSLTHPQGPATNPHVIRDRTGKVMRILVFTTTRAPKTEIAPEVLSDGFELLQSGNINTLQETLSSNFQDFLGEQIQFYLRNYGASIAQELERCFGERLASLVRHGSTASNSHIAITSSRLGWQLRIDPGNKTRDKWVVSKAPQLRRFLGDLAKLLRNESYSRSLSRPGYSQTREFRLTTISRAVRWLLFQDFPHESFYLPAARSGLLQSHRLLASTVVSRASLAGIEDMKIPRMTGVITDFISNLLTMEPRQSGAMVAEISKYLEAELLDGAIRLRSSPNSYPEISYRRRGSGYQLHRTSSMVSEIAPVILYLRNLVSRNDLLIIEEPESHLHPRAQAIFARSLVYLVRIGVSVALTTHSDYFLTELNSAVLTGQFETLEKGGFKVVADKTLPDDWVSAFLFQTTRTGGSTVRNLEVTEQTGIPGDEFAAVAEEMYDRLIQIEESRGQEI